MDRWGLVVVAMACACGGGAGDGDAAGGDAGRDATATDAAPPLGDRDRLLVAYRAFLDTRGGAQTNGLGPGLADTCALWTALAPSAQATFLTLTARLEGSHLADATTMLSHVTALYRVVGGDGATATDPGSCGGGEANRIIAAIDPTLHAALIAANTNQGDFNADGQRDLVDIPAGGFWRDSHDIGGTHAPFDLSDETDGGAPRGQAQYFRDPASAAATSPLGRVDLADVVDPYAFELDQDYDCFHNSNPSCPYTLYGSLCAPQSEQLGTEIYSENYGDYLPNWRPVSCP